MPRPYTDAAELRTELVDRGAFPLVTEASVIILGIGYPAVAEPVPIMCTPGHEYRIRMVEPPNGRSQGRWVLERRKA